MAQPRKLLIADPDLESVRALSRALRERGFQVHYAPDGSRALELAVLRHPELTLFDEACPLVDARTFIGILRSNPRTRDIPVVLTGRALEGDRLRGLRDGFLQKPFNLDEVLSFIEHAIRRLDAARELRGEAREIEGSLGQLGVADVLQILAMNRRTGRLELRREAELGEIWVGDGRPLNARTGPVEGEKALFRLLAWSEGVFAFVPGTPTGKVRIQRGMEDALLEGMRQKDEAARLWAELPPPHTRLQLSVQAEPSFEQHPVTQQVVSLLRQPRTLAELFDLSAATDLETAQALRTLMDEEWVGAVDDAALPSQPLLGPAETHALRSRLLRRRPASSHGLAVAKLLLVGPSAQPLTQLCAELPGWVPLCAEPEAARSGFGTLGQLVLHQALRLEFCVVPQQDAARPLWRPFSSGAIGALVLSGAEPSSLAHFLAFDVRVPLVLLGRELPAGFGRAPAGAKAVAGGMFEATRTLLLRALQPVEPPPLSASGRAGAARQSL